MVENLCSCNRFKAFGLISHVFNVSRKEWNMESLLNPVAIRKPQPKNSRTRRLEALPVVSEKTGVTSGKQIANRSNISSPQHIHYIASNHSSG
jgi:hypothetical protein